MDAATMTTRATLTLTLVAQFDPPLRQKMASCSRANPELAMLRSMMPFLIAILAIPAAAEAAGPAGKAAARRAASQLPPGLPRANYKFRTTIARPAPAPYARAVYVADEPEVLFTPWNGYVPYVQPAVGVAWSPGFPAWSGNWRIPFDYDYQGPWYVGPDIGYWNRQPYGYGWSHYGYGYY